MGSYSCECDVDELDAEGESNEAMLKTYPSSWLSPSSRGSRAPLRRDATDRSDRGTSSWLFSFSVGPAGRPDRARRQHHHRWRWCQLGMFGRSDVDIDESFLCQRFQTKSGSPRCIRLKRLCNSFNCSLLTVPVPQAAFQEVVVPAPKVAIQEVVKQAPAPQVQTLGVIVEVPQVHTGEKGIEEPRLQFMEKMAAVPQTVVQEAVGQVPKVMVQEVVKQVPRFKVHEVVTHIAAPAPVVVSAPVPIVETNAPTPIFG